MLLSPDGANGFYERGTDEGLLAPMGYFHSIEYVGEGEMEGIAFFDNPEMAYVGLGEVFGTVSDHVFASPSGWMLTISAALNNRPDP